ncbi:MAG: insulinase family protein [Eubacteriales bacterium]|nr:insulinase family protein [Eubacteriales bacterium]
MAYNSTGTTEKNMAQEIMDLPAYEVVSHEYLADAGSDSWLLRHRKTGARIALLPGKDNNKVFYIAFRTPPEDSTGVAHIIEHTVLCGSRNFPVKDPFIELAKGSLNTFLNAMTYPDKTVYPVASCNEQDFKNLMHVYLDAVFYPNIYREQNIFRQEGWHYEADSAEGEITVNGVVYNEMKGALSSPDDILGREINAVLYPHTPYVHESGGDPVNIPDLTYESYLEFHRRYYHPSNSYIYLYGDMDMAERLEWIDTHYLSRFEKLDIDSSIPLEPPFKAPVESSRFYSILPEEDPAGKSFLSWNVSVLPDSLDAGRSMALKILNYALCDAEGAPVRRALRDRGLGEDIYTVFESGIRQPSYSIVAKYADPARKDEFVRVIRQTLEKTAQEGISPRALEAGINMYEFRYREADYGSYSKGLIYGLNALDSWLYDDEKPFVGLQIGDFFDVLREKAKDGYFEDMIRTCLLDNPHCAVVVLEPEQGLSDRLDGEMRERMKKFADGCSPAERQAIVDELDALRVWQQTPDPEEDLRRIPMLAREDLTRKAVPVLNRVQRVSLTAGTAGPSADRDSARRSVPVTAGTAEISGIPETAEASGITEAPGTPGAFCREDAHPAAFTAVTHPLSTNHIDYLTFIFDIRDLPEKYIRCLGVFRTLFSVLNTASYDYAALGHEINISTGGLNAVVSGYNWYGEGPRPEEETPAAGRGKYRLTFEVTMKCLHKNLKEALALVGEILMTTDYRMPARILEVLEEERAGMRAAMTSAGHATALQRALSYLSEPGAIMDRVTGLGAYETLDETCASLLAYKENENAGQEPGLCVLLQEMAAAVFRSDNLTFDCTACEEDLPAILDVVRELADRLPGTPKEHFEPFVPAPVKKNEGLTTAGQIQFVCRAGSYASPDRPATGAFRVLRVLLGYEYLWNRVRVKGGAYGCMSGFNRDGYAYLVSYRDPHLKQTLETFEKTGDFLRGFTADERTMTKYIIGAVSGLDQPMTPFIYGRYSLSAYLNGLTGEYLQRERDEVLDCTQESIRALAEYVDAVMENECLCVVGSDAKIRENAELFGEIRKLV